MKHSQLNPQLIVISAPSGAGKSTVCRSLSDKNENYKLSVSATTRPPRQNEKHAADYFFMTDNEFKKKIEDDQFIEYEKVHGHYYGTLKTFVDNLLKAGKTVLFDIDVKGALHIKKYFPGAILIFIHPPSLEELKHRLRTRKSDDEKTIEKRLKRLPEEYQLAAYFDYQIVNEKIEQTVKKIDNIIKKHR